ncbi:hypothetical protein HID58_091366 [Brassica napus]|uniref:Uncharacterized protein n=1 Tax=Brassica napus TaxID=3708 RepID=A0ABQ7X0F9_BRANA|nr:hypothetical protein HID58_091366 [Brassica napus]
MEAGFLVKRKVTWVHKKGSWAVTINLRRLCLSSCPFLLFLDVPYIGFLCIAYLKASPSLVLSLRMVIGVCAWLSQEDNTSLVDLEQHQKQALGVRTNGLRFMDPRQEDLEEKWL